MASILDMSASSDSEDDADYVPIGAAGDCSSHEEDVSGDEDFNTVHFDSKKTKATKRGEEPEIKSDSPAKVDEKQRAKDLWESFLNDVESATPNKNSNFAVCNSSITSDNPNEIGAKVPNINAKPVYKVFDFAGETVTVFGKDLNSCDSLLQQTAPEKNNSEPVTTEKPPFDTSKKRGIDSVLGTIMNKSKKLSVLDKTLIDWKMFKKDEGLDNDLKKFNKGKQGFIERQRFLERSDLRTFEMEKSMRQRVRKK